MLNRLCDEPPLLQGHDPVVDRWTRNLKIALHVGLGGRNPVNLRVVINERQVLALRFRVGRFHLAIVDFHRLFVNGSVRKVSGLAARSVIDHPLWGRANVRRFIIMMVVDLVPRNGQFCALNCVYQSQYIRVRHRPGPPAGGQCDPSWHLQDSKPKDSWIALK
jgi:hypothetical protein